MNPLPPLTFPAKLLAGVKTASRYVEAWYPLSLGVVAAVVFCRFRIDDAVFKSVITKVLPTAVSVTAILAGFQGAGQAILLGILESGTIAYLKRTGHYKNLVSYLWRAILMLFSAAVLSLVVLVVDASGKPQWLSNAWTLAILAGTMIYAAAASYRISRLMFKVLLQEADSEGRPPTCLVKPSDKPVA